MEYNKILLKDGISGKTVKVSDKFVEEMKSPEETYEAIFKELMESAIFIREDTEKGYRLALAFTDIDFETNTLIFTVKCEFFEEDIDVSHTYALSLFRDNNMIQVTDDLHEGIIVQLEPRSSKFIPNIEYYYEPLLIYGLGFSIYYFHEYDGSVGEIYKRNPLFENLFFLKHQHDDLLSKRKDLDKAILKAKGQLQKMSRKHEKLINELREDLTKEVVRNELQNKEIAVKLKTLREEHIITLKELENYRKQERKDLNIQQLLKGKDEQLVKAEDEVKALRKQLADNERELNSQFSIIEKLRNSKDKQERKVKSLQEYQDFLEVQLEELTDKYESMLFQLNKDDDKYLKISDSSLKVKLRNLKVLVIGGHVNWQNKLKEIYPEFSYIASDNVNFNVGMLKTADLVFFNILHCSHTLYYKVKENINWGRDKSEYKDRLVYVNSNSLEDFTLSLKEKLKLM